MKPRRPLKTRQRPAAIRLAAWLAGRGVQPNQISYTSIAFAAAAGASLAALPHVPDTGKAVLLVCAALAIQLRLLANLLDGMIAVEGGRRGPTGELFNDVPDRIADLLILVLAGYGITWIGWGDALGWAAGAAAVLTAYVRGLGGALGVSQHFCGPMAKPHRMALMTVACLASLAEIPSGYSGRVLTIALVLVTAGSLVTFARRLRRVAEELRAR